MWGRLGLAKQTLKGRVLLIGQGSPSTSGYVCSPSTLTFQLCACTRHVPTKSCATAACCRVSAYRAEISPFTRTCGLQEAEEPDWLFCCGSKSVAHADPCEASSCRIC